MASSAALRDGAELRYFLVYRRFGAFLQKRRFEGCCYLVPFPLQDGFGVL
jgi:hypothetical protein